MTKILVTNNGTHPPEKWAIATAEQIFNHPNGGVQAQKFQLSIAELLTPIYEQIQIDEDKKLHNDVAHILSPHLVLEDYLDAVIEAIAHLAIGTAWQAHFGDPKVQSAARYVLASHLATAQHVERLWYAEQNPDCAHARSYKSTFQGA